MKELSLKDWYEIEDDCDHFGTVSDENSRRLMLRHKTEPRTFLLVVTPDADEWIIAAFETTEETTAS